MTDAFLNRILSVPKGVMGRCRVCFFRLLGMRIGQGCWLRAVHIPRNPWDIELADGVALDDGVVLLTTGARTDSRRLRLGQRVYVNRWTMFDVSESVTIGADSMIGPFVYVTDHDHGTKEGRRLAEQPLVGAPVEIGCNVWIGAGATILKGVTIGNNAVIGAGSVVTKDVADGARVAGVPSRNIPQAPNLHKLDP